MSNLIYEGDIIANFGRYLPTPYIQSIIIDADSSDNMNMIVNLYIHVDASEFTDDITLEEQIEKLDFYWMWSDTLLEDNQLVFDLVNDSASNIFLIDKEAMIDSGTIMYDSEGNRIIRYLIAGEYLASDGATWDDINDLYVYAFSTSEDLSEDYWNPLSSGYPIDDGDHWKEFLKTETSDIAYEQVMENGNIPDPTEIIWVDANDAAYADPPLQAITSLYYKSNKITHEEIVESFQELVAEYQEQAETDSHLKDVLDNISYILEIYGNEVDLLPKLNEFRKAFPSKTSATSPGRVYLKYRKKIYTANSIIELDEQLYKKVVSNSKIIDSRDHDFTEATSLELTDVCISDCTEDCELVSNFTFDRQLLYYHTTGGSYDEGVIWELVGVNHGFFFFDYDKAQTYLSNAALVTSDIDINKVKELWGDDIFNLTYQLKEVKLERQFLASSGGGILPGATPVGAVDTLMDMVTGYSYDNAFPEAGSTGHTYYGDFGDAAGYYEYSQNFPLDTSYEAAAEQLEFCIAKSYLTLRNFDLVPEADGVDSALGDYGLMCFEFQDIMSEDVAVLGDTDEEEYEYVATVTIEDNTLDVFGAIISVFGEFSTDFLAYYEAALEACAYSSADGVFNDYFINWATDTWPELSTAPWVMAPAVYYLYLDMLEGTFDGDYALIALATQTMSSAISPQNGTLDQLISFASAFLALEGLIEAIDTPEDSDEGWVMEKTYSCTQDINEKNIFEDVAGTMCDVVHTEIFTSVGLDEAPAEPAWVYQGGGTLDVGWTIGEGEAEAMAEWLDTTSTIDADFLAGWWMIDDPSTYCVGSSFYNDMLTGFELMEDTDTCPDESDCMFAQYVHMKDFDDAPLSSCTYAPRFYMLVWSWAMANDRRGVLDVDVFRCDPMSDVPGEELCPRGVPEVPFCWQCCADPGAPEVFVDIPCIRECDANDYLAGDCTPSDTYLVVGDTDFGVWTG